VQPVSKAARRNGFRENKETVCGAGSVLGVLEPLADQAGVLTLSDILLMKIIIVTVIG